MVQNIMGQIQAPESATAVPMTAPIMAVPLATTGMYAPQNWPGAPAQVYTPDLSNPAVQNYMNLLAATQAAGVPQASLPYATTVAGQSPTSPSVIPAVSYQAPVISPPSTLATSATLQMRIIYAVIRADNDATLIYADWLVAFNLHAMTRTTGV